MFDFYREFLSRAPSAEITALIVLVVFALFWMGLAIYDGARRFGLVLHVLLIAITLIGVSVWHVHVLSS